jgi:hypothetical protein
MGMSSVVEADRLPLCYGRRMAVDNLAFDADLSLGKGLALVAGQISGVFYLSVGLVCWWVLSRLILLSDPSTAAGC